jgi:pimeloyl-ACP methyl ester carboxylesterase
MPTAHVDDIQLIWEEAGAGSPLVLVHEFGGDARSWAPQLQHFAARHRVIAYNQRGYPPSSVPLRALDYSQERLVRDLAMLLDEIEPRRVHLCGCSMGANVARDYTIAHPDRVHSLILVGAGAGSTDREAFLKSQQAIAAALDAEGIESLVRNFSQNPTRSSFRRKDPQAFAEFLRGVREHDSRACAHLAREVLVKRKTIFDLEAELRALLVPTLIIVGDRDESCFAPSLQLRRWIPHSGLLVLPDCGHTPNLEEVEFFNRVLGDFLASVEAGSWAGWTGGGETQATAL